ncbi:MAG TPA: hypothetical protein VHA14_13195 [Bryobacteraceae bacterium]|nr:hypothetical protein [Bryobacteraceae bacterium]
MKKLAMLIAVGALWIPAFGAQQTVTGKISDAMCASDHSMMQRGGSKLSDKQCVQECVKSGQKYVLVSKGKVYQIQNQNSPGLAENAGGSVKVTGDASADGKSINISKIEAAK